MVADTLFSIYIDNYGFDTKINIASDSYTVCACKKAQAHTVVYA